MRSTTTILILLCALGCVSCIFPSYQVEKHEEEPKKRTAVLADYKLPDNIEPIHYGIKLIPYMDEAPHPKKFTFDGDISITIKVLKATDMIRMHAHNLTIYHDAVSVTNEGSGEKQNITSVKQTEPDDDRQFLDIFLENELEENTYTIKIHFEGTLNSDLAGFYRSGYKENNKQKWMLVTQFEPTAARRAFPCFDEPALKATYDVSIARRKGWTVLSNMPQNDQLRKPLPRQKGYTWVYFKQSLKMSSYLVAFAVSQFKSITSPIDARFKVWARPELIHTGKYAADVAPKVVQCLENRTNHKYDLPKSDHIAVQDFEYGAMENWGLITYRETALLYNEENSTTYSKQATASVIAHELAHQWFGNLVSPKWWSNLWLNEGFATFLANYIGSCVEPKMAFMEQFLTAPLARALEKDALEDAHPLVVPVASPSEIKAIFDGISYSKGGSVIRMMHSILGEENFWKGLRAYIEKMQFSNADQNDLWRGLSTAVPNGLLPNNVEFKDIMDTWALQAGYPVVTVTRDYDKNTVSFTQKRFFSSAPVKKEHNEVYWVPLTMLVQGEPKENGNNITWLYNKTITMASPSSDKWILVNNEKNGYYRVNYDKENWKKLSESINGAQLVNTLSVNNRVQLLLDSFALAKAKVLDYEPALLMTNYLNYETELTPWNAVLDEFNYIYDRMIGDESLMTMFENFLKSKMSHLYEHVNGFGASESDEHPLRLLRIRVVVWLCEMGYEACNKDASALFNQWKTSNVKIHPDLKRTVLKTGMRMGGEDEYNFLYKKYKESTDLSKYTYLIAMAASKDKDILSRMLRDSIAEQSPFKTEDALTIINMVRANPVGTDLALDFVITNYFNATKQWGNGGYAFLYLVGSLNTDDQKQKITNFLQSHNATLTEAARANIKYTLTTLEKNMQWNSEFKETFAKFVGPYDSSGDGSNGLLIALFAIIVLIALAFGLKKFFLDKQNNGIILRS